MRANLILILFAALLAPLTYATWKRSAATFTDYAEIPLLFPGFVEENVARIVISQPVPRAPGAQDQVGPQPSNELIIDRTLDGGWEIKNTDLAGVGARSAEVRRAVLSHLGSIRKDERAVVVPSASDEQLVDFDLDETTATRVRVYDGLDQRAPIVDLLHGRSSIAGPISAEPQDDRTTGYFVRRADERDVVFYETDSWILRADPNAYAERQVLKFAVADSVRVRLKNRTGIVGFERAQADVGSWGVITKPDGERSAPSGVGAVRQSLVTELLNQLSRLKVSRYLGPLETSEQSAYGLDHGNSKIIAWVELADGTEFALQIGNKLETANEHYAGTDKSPLLFTVGDWVVDALERDVRDLFDPGEGSGGGGVSDTQRKPGGVTDGGGGDDGAAPDGPGGGESTDEPDSGGKTEPPAQNDPSADPGTGPGTTEPRTDEPGSGDPPTDKPGGG